MDNNKEEIKKENVEVKPEQPQQEPKPEVNKDVKPSLTPDELNAVYAKCREEETKQSVKTSKCNRIFLWGLLTLCAASLGLQAYSELKK